MGVWMDAWVSGWLSMGGRGCVDFEWVGWRVGVLGFWVGVWFGWVCGYNLYKYALISEKSPNIAKNH